MKYSQLFLGIFCFGLVAWAGPALASTSFSLTESLEWYVADSDLVVLGSYAAIDTIDLDGYDMLKVTIQVQETLKGPSDKQNVFLVDRPSPETLAAFQKQKGRNLLLFLANSERYAKDHPALTACRWATCHPAIGLDAADLTVAWTLATGMPGRREVAGREEVLKIARESAAHSAGKKMSSHSVCHSYGGGPPIITEHVETRGNVTIRWSEGVAAHVHSDCFTVPVDPRLETFARLWLQSDEQQMRRAGIDALQYFPSDENIELLKALYHDPFYETETRAREKIPYFPIHLLLDKQVEVRTYPIRKKAYEMLQKWGAAGRMPVLEESARGYQPLAISLGAGTAFLALVLLVWWRLRVRRRRMLAAVLILCCLALPAPASAALSWSLTESLEWQVADADLVLLGKYAAIDTLDLDGYEMLKVTIQVQETLKGPGEKEIVFLVDRPSAEEREACAKQKGRNLLLMLVKSERCAKNQPALTACPWALRSAIDLDAAELKAETLAAGMPGRRGVADREELLKIARESAAHSAGKKMSSHDVRHSFGGGPPIVTEHESHSNGVTIRWSTAVAASVSIDSFTVPVDRRLESFARLWLQSDEEQMRRAGIDALQYFPSEENIVLIKALYNDPFYKTETRAREKIPYFPIHLLLDKQVEVRIYPVRKEAYEALQKWGAAGRMPVLEEPTRGYQPLAIWLGGGTAFLALVLLVAWRLRVRRRRALAASG